MDDKRDHQPERQRVITVRLSPAMHGALITEAHTHQTSLNQLCIAKLSRPLVDDAADSLEIPNRAADREAQP